MTTTIITRAGKASPLTSNEVDDNFINLKTTADAALPKAGGAVSGAITTTSTVDGRNLSVDGSKLDGIEAGATGDQTAAEIRAAIVAAIDSNVFTDADHTKLNAIEANANVTDTANVTAAGALMTTGGSLSGNLNLGDNVKAQFGAGNDLQIYHDGSNSYISDVGTGALFLKTNYLAIAGANGNQLINAEQGGAIELYHANAKILETKATGADISGVLTADGLTSSGDAVFQGNVTHNNNNASSKYFKLNVASSGDGHLLLQRNNTNYWQIHSDGSNVLKFDGYNGASSAVFSGSVTSAGLTVAQTGSVSSTPFSVSSNLNSGHAIAEFRSTGNSNSSVAIRADGTGDPSIQFNLSGVTPFVMGVDNSDGDKFKISDHYIIGNNDRFVVDGSTGNINIPQSLMVGSTTAPTDLITIQSPASGGGNGITIKRNDNGTDQRVGAISFGNTVDSDLAQITVQTSVGNNGDGNLLFHTQPNGGSSSERLRINADGSSVFSGDVYAGGATVPHFSSAESITAPTGGFKPNSATIPALYLGNATADGPIISLMDASGTPRGVFSIQNSTAKTLLTTNFGFKVVGNQEISGNVTMQHDDALLFMKETDGTNIAAVGDLTGEGQGGAFYYNHGGTAVIQLKSYEASTIGHGLNVGGSVTSTGLNIDTTDPFMSFKESGATKLFIGESSVVGGGGAGFYDFYAIAGLGQRFFTGAAERIRIFSGGNTSIGSSTDLGYKLNVVGNALFRTDSAATSFGNHSSSIRIQNKNTTDNNYAGIVFDGSTNAAGAIQFQYTDQSGSYGDICFETRGSGGYAERLRIDSSGNATFSGSVSATGDIEAKAGNELRVYRTDNATYGSIEYLTGAGGLKLRDVNGDGMTFAGATSNYLTIASTTGNVNIPNSKLGIGFTSAPFTKSHIKDTAWSSGAPYGAVQLIEGNNVNDDNWGHLVITDTTTDNGNGGSIRFATGASSSLNPFAGVSGVSEGGSYGGLAFYTRPSGGTATERIKIDSSGRLLLGLSSATGYSADQDNFIIKGSAEVGMHIIGGTSSTTAINFGDGTDTAAYRGQITYHNADDSMRLNTAGQERARLTSGGILLVGKSSTGLNTVGHQFGNDGYVYHTRAGDIQFLNRTNGSGVYTYYMESGAEKGRIGTDPINSDLYIGNGDTAIMFHDGNDAIFPHNTSTDTSRDAAIDIGYSSYRFKDLYLSGTANAGRAHIKTASSGASADVSADELVVESNGNAGISILSGQSNSGSIYFGDAGVNYDGYIAYAQATRSMTFGTAAGSRMTIDSSGSVSIGTTDSHRKLTVSGQGSASCDILIHNDTDTDNSFNGLMFKADSQNNNTRIKGAVFFERTGTRGTGTLHLCNDGGNDDSNVGLADSKLSIASSGNVGINAPSPAATLHTVANAGTTALLVTGAASNNIASFYTSGGSQAMTLTSGGALLVGKTSSSFSTTGTELLSDGAVTITRSGTAGGTPFFINRLANSGELIAMYQDTVQVGSIGTAGGQSYIHGAGTDVGLYWGSNNIYPYRSTGLNDATIDIGHSSYRFKDLYITGLNVTYSTYNKISSYFSGSYTSGFKFSDMNGGIWYDAGTDDLTVSAGHANSQLILESGGSEAARLTSDGALLVGTSSSLGGKLTISGKDDAGAGDLLRLQFDNSPPDTGITFVDIFNTVKNRISMDAGNNSDLQISAGTQMKIFAGTTGSSTGDQKLLIDGDGATIYNGRELRVKRPNGSGDIRLFNTTTYATLESTVDPIYIKSANAIRFDTGGNNQRMLLDNSGNLLVGTTDTTLWNDNADNYGHNILSNGQYYSSTNGEINAYLNRQNSDGAILAFAKDGTNVGSIGTANGDLHIDGDTGIRFQDTSIMPRRAGSDVDATVDIGLASHRWKDLYLSGGVHLGGTGSANKLDDYEEGTWTPFLPHGGSLGVQGATYTKIGREVSVRFYVTSITPTNNSTTFVIGGLPFNTSAISSSYGAGSFSYTGTSTGNLSRIGMLNNINQSIVYFHWIDGTSGNVLSNSDWIGLHGSGSGKHLIASISYITDL